METHEAKIAKIIFKKSSLYAHYPKECSSGFPQASFKSGSGGIYHV